MSGEVCEIEVPTRLIEMFRDPLVDLMFPSINYEVRADVIKYLYGREDTAYGVSIGITKPLPSVAKALKDLEKRGYVVREVKKSSRREKEANIYRLSKLGELAAFVLLSPNVDLPPINVSKDSVLDNILNINHPQYKDVIIKWLDNRILRKLLVIFTPFYLSEYITENEKLDQKYIEWALANAILKVIDIFSAITTYEILKEMRDEEDEGKVKYKIISLMEKSFIDLKMLIPEFVGVGPIMDELTVYSLTVRELLKCRETRRILTESVRVWLDYVQKLSLNTMIVSHAIIQYIESGDLSKVREKMTQLYAKITSEAS